MRIVRKRVSFKKKSTAFDVGTMCIVGWDAHILVLIMDTGNSWASSGKFFFCERVYHNLLEAKLSCENNQI